VEQPRVEVVEGPNWFSHRSWVMTGTLADRIDTLLWLEQHTEIPTMLVSMRESLRIGIGLDYAKAPLEAMRERIAGEGDSDA